MPTPVRMARGMSLGEPVLDEGSAEQQAGQSCSAISGEALPQSGSGDEEP